MTSLRSQRRALPWRHNDGTPVGRRNPTVAALRAVEPKRKRGKQRLYGPKGSSRLLGERVPLSELSPEHVHIDIRTERR
jgi:hypothetical protein